VSRWLHIIGLGEKGWADLPARLQDAISHAELIVGGRRHLDLIGKRAAPEHEWRTPLSHSIAEIVRWRGRRVVVLASGDPMHFGIGATLARHISPAEMEVDPAPSSFSLAAARLGWALQDVACLSIHNRPLAALGRELCPGRRLLVLTDSGSSPAQCAEWLTERGYGASLMTIFEHLGGPREHFIEAPARDWKSEWRVADLNLLAIECRLGGDGQPLSLAPGLPDDCYLHDGKITKAEVRSATLAALRPMVGDMLWDVGAGCGSVGIEWMRQHRAMRAAAIEHDEARLHMIATNARQLCVADLQIVAGSAPEALADLPSPHAIFIGGGIAQHGVVERCWDALLPEGRLVANVVTAEGEQAVFRAREKFGGDMVRFNVQRLDSVGSYQGWKPLMPITQWRAEKK
jgi:precorrin-6Y C5,15-methyltransferase (decarboxylating)